MLPLTSDDLHIATSAHGSFADALAVLILNHDPEACLPTLAMYILHFKAEVGSSCSSMARSSLTCNGPATRACCI